jgi:hypothetical protein
MIWWLYHMRDLGQTRDMNLHSKTEAQSEEKIKIREKMEII